MTSCGGCFDPSVFSFGWTRADVPPSAIRTIGHGFLPPPGTALWGHQGCGHRTAWAHPRVPQRQHQLFRPDNHQGTAVAPAPAVLTSSLPCNHHLQGQNTQQSQPSTASPLGTPLGSGSPPGSAVPKNEGTPTRGDLSMDSDVTMDDGTPLGGDLSMDCDVIMDEVTTPSGDITMDSDVTMDDGTSPGGDITMDCDVTMDGDTPLFSDMSLASDVTMDEGTSAGGDVTMPNDVTMDEGTLPGGDNPVGRTSDNNISLKKRVKKCHNVSVPKKGIKRRAPTASAGAGGWD